MPATRRSPRDHQLVPQDPTAPHSPEPIPTEFDVLQAYSFERQANYPDASLYTSSVAPRPTDTRRNSRPRANRRTTSHAAKKPEGHIPRPPNCFLLYRSWVRQNKMQKIVEGRKNEQNVSVIVGQLWDDLPEHHKDVFRRQAAIMKAEHQARYPNYKYCPKSKKGETKRKAKKMDAEENKVCLEVAAQLKSESNASDEELLLANLGQIDTPQILPATQFAPLAAQPYRRSSSCPLPGASALGHGAQHTGASTPMSYHPSGSGAAGTFRTGGGAADGSKERPTSSHARMMPPGHKLPSVLRPANPTHFEPTAPGGVVFTNPFASYAPAPAVNDVSVHPHALPATDMPPPPSASYHTGFDATFSYSPPAPSQAQMQHFPAENVVDASYSYAASPPTSGPHTPTLASSEAPVQPVSSLANWSTIAIDPALRSPGASGPSSSGVSSPHIRAQSAAASGPGASAGMPTPPPAPLDRLPAEYTTPPPPSTMLPDTLAHYPRPHHGPSILDFMNFDHHPGASEEHNSHSAPPSAVCPPEHHSGPDGMDLDPFSMGLGLGVESMYSSFDFSGTGAGDASRRSSAVDCRRNSLFWFRKTSMAGDLFANGVVL